MGQAYFLVETEEKKQTLQAVVKDRGAVLVAPLMAAVVEAKNIDHLARGEEGFLFRPSAASHEVLKEVLQGGTRDIYLAFDRSEQGEYSSWLWAGMIGQLSKGALQCRRLHLASLDEKGVIRAMELVEPVDSAQAAGFYFEECFQRCLATHLQRLLGTRSGPGNIPLSIPVLTILALLAEREKDVREFSGKPKWQVELTVKGPKGEFPAQLKEVFGVCCDGTLEGREQAKAVAEDLVGQSFRVVSCQENSLEIPAPQPYTLYELVFDAFRYGQIPVAEALQAAITLLSGVVVGGTRQALISTLYPVGLAKMQFLAEAVGQHVVDRFGADFLQNRPLVGHGIMPLVPELEPAALTEMSGAVQKIYELVWCRAMASQMPAGIGKEVILGLETEKYRLQSDYRVIEEPGFLQVYQYGFSTLLSGQSGDAPGQDEEVTVSQVVPEQRFGMVADHYTLTSLADDLEELGIERPEEVVQNIGRLCAAGYITMQGSGTLQCGPNLIKVVNTLNRAFPGMQGLNLIVYYAQTIDEVTSGRKRFQMALKQFDQSLIMQGQPLVKIKLPTSLPQRLKKSKSIIKSDVLPVGATKAVPASAQEEAAFVDFGAMTAKKQGQVPEITVEAENVRDIAVDSGLADEASSGGAVAGERPVAIEKDGAEVPAVAGPDDLSGEELAFIEEDDETALYDEEAAAEAEKLFNEAEEQLVAPVAGAGTGTEVPQQMADTLAKKEDGHGALDVATKPCPQCGRAMVRKGDRFGYYWACTGVPACRHTEGAQEEEGEDVPDCPLCHQGQLVVKRTPTGKDMYVCRREACEFMAWSRPHAIHCPLCSSPFLVEKKGVGGQVVLRCPKAGCNYIHGREGAEGQGAPVVRKKVVVRRVKGGTAGSGKRKVVVRRRKA